MRKTQFSLILTFCACITTSLLLSGCKKDDPDPQEEQIKALAGTWNLSSVSNDGSDVTTQYQQFTLTLTADKTYSTTNGGNPWPARGTFDFPNETVTDRVTRDDNVVVTISEVTTSRLVLNFSINSVGSGSAAGITGSFTFTLTK
ncbi:MAG: hypothetical protein HEP71_32855 [Roseivirga sp.]|nr:hypothetical protein [Roseivirga sp.]